MSDPLESAKMLQDAFKSYRDISPPDAVRVLDASIRLYTQKGNFRRAADLMCDLGDTYEKMEDVSKALECLETAITWYTDEGIHATANKARQKAGMLAAVKGDYYKAVGIFVKGAEASMSTGPTGRFIVKTYLFKAGSELLLDCEQGRKYANTDIVCQLGTGDVVGTKKALESWNQLDRGFDGEREGRFIRDLTEALEAQEPDKVAQIAADWDRMTKMEDWMVTVLLHVKKLAEGEEEDFS
jgi:alpha-soluble NSF attachment protein